VAKKTRNAKAGSGKTRHGSSQRRVVFFAALLAVMTATSALLLALAPAPLAPGATSSLWAVGTPDSLDSIFQTTPALEPGRWKYVFVHQSLTDSGDAGTLGESAGGLPDHFVIGNGKGCGDGEVQVAQRWHRQKSAGRVEGLKSIDSACISVCVIGDFNRARPTRNQVVHLSQLVAALQERCGIPAGNVQVLEGDASPAGVGKQFPASALREALLP
jgi:hypothetical protein